MDRTVNVIIKGRVQGVSFRYWTRTEARGLGLSGWVRNRADGSVEAVFRGAQADVEQMIARCHEGPRAARVDGVEVAECEDGGFDDFEIRF